MPSYYEIMIALYKRQQGILWKHREHEQKQFLVSSKRSHEVGYENISVTPEYPAFENDPDYPASMQLSGIGFEMIHFKLKISLKFQLKNNYMNLFMIPSMKKMVLM